MWSGDKLIGTATEKQGTRENHGEECFGNHRESLNKVGADSTPGLIRVLIAIGTGIMFVFYRFV